MKIVDLNVLIYLVDRDSSHHARIRKWWDTIEDQSDRIGLSWLVILGFLRITTNPRIFSDPIPLR